MIKYEHLYQTGVEVGCDISHSVCCLMTSHLGPVSDSTPTAVHCHRAPLIQCLLRWLQQDGQTAVGHLTLLHRTHQLIRKQEVTWIGQGQFRQPRANHSQSRPPEGPTTHSSDPHAWFHLLKLNSWSQRWALTWLSVRIFCCLIFVFRCVFLWLSKHEWIMKRSRTEAGLTQRGEWAWPKVGVAQRREWAQTETSFTSQSYTQELLNCWGKGHNHEENSIKPSKPGECRDQLTGSGHTSKVQL